MVQNKLLRYTIILGIVFCVDRLTKLWALKYAVQRCVVNQWLSFDLVYNRGISWGMLHTNSSIGFALVTALIVLVTIILATYTFYRWREGHVVYGEMMVFAGSCANLIDRFVYGGVVDFILFSYGSYSFPVFNIADAAIVMGVALMAIMGMRE